MLIKMITIALMAAFYVCYFAKMISQKKKGIRTDQLGRGKTGFVRFVERSLKVTTCVLPFLQLLCIAFFGETRYAALRCAGVGLTAAGVAAFVSSVLQMKDNWRAGVQRKDRTSLVTTGIYSVSRNPAFLGFDLMYLGILLTYFHRLLCLATGIALLLFHLQIVRVEEAFLAEAFGAEYLQYKAKVCRYLGRK